MAIPANDGELMGADITFGKALLGHVEGLGRDPLSHRVWRLITSYGDSRRRVGVPMEWVLNHSPTRLVLASAHALWTLSASGHGRELCWEAANSQPYAPKSFPISKRKKAHLWP